jgi:carnitine 3-dehydrogenase
VTYIEPTEVKQIAVVGGGLIGASWAAYFLAKGFSVAVFDPSAEARGRVRSLIAAAWPAMIAAGITSVPDPRMPSLHDDLNGACANADFVQESGPEDIDLKRELFARIDGATPGHVVIASSSSSLLPSDYQVTAVYPERVLAAHPFNPPSLIPLVEIAGGGQTSSDAVDWAMDFFTLIGKVPVRVRREVPGYIANRMSAALFREAVDLVASGVASVADVDKSITAGPGLRWAAMGPHMIYHLAGGQGGYRQYLEHLGPAQQRRWQSLGESPLTPDIIDILVAGIEDELDRHSVHDATHARDMLVARIMNAIVDVSAPHPS